MSDIITLTNHGKLYLSINAGAFRLLVPTPPWLRRIDT